MKKLFVLFVSGLLSLTGMAQKSSLVGTWQLLDANGFPTTSVKIYMPDGKLLALSFNSDFSNSSVWFMANYEVLSDTSFVERAFYHSNIIYQDNSYITYRQENDSLRITYYTAFQPNGRLYQSTGRWKKMDRPMPSFTDAEWQALYQKSLIEFDRLPKEGQTVEQFAQERLNKSQDYKKRNKLDFALEELLIRADLDTANIEWQKDAVSFCLENNMSPSVGEKITDRYIRLVEAAAPVANDTSVLNAYRMKAYLCNYRGNPGMPQVREMATKCIEAETAAGHQPSKAYGLDYFMLAQSYMAEGNMEKVYENSMKCIDILEKASDVDDNQKAEAYMIAAFALMVDVEEDQADVMQCGRQSIELLKKSVSLFCGDRAFKITSMVYPSMLGVYAAMLAKNPKDKKLQKEVEQFMADKLLYDVFEATDKEHNLWGEYIVLEKGNWTLENPAGVDNGATHYLLQKGDEYREVEVKEDEKLPGVAHIRPVDAATKKDVISQWKAYRKKMKK